jgi:GNAT superfamily N-acetyltransferase
MAFVALDKEQKQLLGVARLAADPDYVKGEYAIIVRSDLKGTGIGWALMRHLIHYAEKEGLRELVGDVLASNERMLEMCRAWLRDRRRPRRYVDPQGAARASRDLARRCEARRGAGLLIPRIVIAHKT